MGLLDRLFNPKPADPVPPLSDGPSAGAAFPGRVPGQGRAGFDPVAPKSAEQPASLPEPQKPPGAIELTLTLDDILTRIPTRFLAAGMLDTARVLKFRRDDLVADMANGRMSVRLEKIAAQYPEAFTEAAAQEKEVEVRLPLQRMLEQLMAAGVPLPPPQTAPAQDAREFSDFVEKLVASPATALDGMDSAFPPPEKPPEPPAAPLPPSRAAKPIAPGWELAKPLQLDEPPVAVAPPIQAQPSVPVESEPATERESVSVPKVFSTAAPPPPIADEIPSAVSPTLLEVPTLETAARDDGAGETAAVSSPGAGVGIRLPTLALRPLVLQGQEEVATPPPAMIGPDADKAAPVLHGDAPVPDQPAQPVEPSRAVSPLAELAAEASREALVPPPSLLDVWAKRLAVLPGVDACVVIVGGRIASAGQDFHGGDPFALAQLGARLGAALRDGAGLPRLEPTRQTTLAGVGCVMTFIHHANATLCAVHAIHFLPAGSREQLVAAAQALGK